MKKIKLTFILGMCAASMALADAPVIDISSQPGPIPTGTTISKDGAPVQNMPAPNGDDSPEAPHATQYAATPTDNSGDASATDAPATDTSDNNSASVPVVDTSSLPIDQRVSRLESQVNNMVRMNLPQQVAELQQQLAQLRGQLQVQAHDLKLLNQQQRTFYQDLDGRIKQLSNMNSNGSDSSSDTSSKLNTNVLNSSQASLQLKESDAFQAAINYLTKKQYDKAINAFQGYLSDYPNGHYVANAHYWLGDIYYMQQKNKQAEREFTILIGQFAKSAKVPDAKLKLAIIHANDGKISQAREELEAIKKQHPDSTAAQLANIRLQQLNAMNKK